MTSVFTPEEYGQYQIALSTLGFLGIFASIWMVNTVTRMYWKHKIQNAEQAFFSTLFVLYVLIVFVVTIVAWCANAWVFHSRINPELFTLINLIIATLIFNAFFEIFVTVFRAGQLPKSYSFFWVLFSVGRPLVGIALILFGGFRVNGMFWGYLFVSLVLDIALIGKLRLYRQFNIRKVSWPLMKQFFSYGIPFSLSQFAFWILTLSDRYLIGLFRGSGEIGLYSVGYTISEKTMSFTYMILMLAAYPIIVEIWETQGEKNAQKLIKELTRYFFLLCTPILFILATIPERILALFSTAEFSEGADVIPLLAFGLFLVGLNQYVLKGFELRQKSLMIGILAIAAGACNVGLNLVLLPRLGIRGAGISACSAYIIYFILSVISVRKALAWKPSHSSILRVLLCGGCSALIGHFLSGLFKAGWTATIMIVALGWMAFVLGLILSGELRREEIRLAWNWVRDLSKRH